MIGRASLLFWTFFALVYAESSPKETTEVTAEPGQNVTLECRGSKDAAIKAQAWRRFDLWDGYVFFWSETQSIEELQISSFLGRVELRDPEMKDGDASLILKNVKVNDTGLYRCVIITRNNTAFSQRVNLKVGSGHTAGNSEEGGDEERRKLTAALVTVAVVVCVVGLVAGFVLWKRKRSQQQNSDPPPAADEAAELQTV